MRPVRMAALVAVLAAATIPARAQVPSAGAGIGMDSSADAYWETTQDVSDTQVRISVRYLAASAGRNGWSEVFTGSMLCDKTDDGGGGGDPGMGPRDPESPPLPGDVEPVPCVVENWAQGWADPGSFTFKMNPLLLRSAHLEGTYWMQSYDDEGNPIDDGRETIVVADWTPDGRIQRGGGTQSFHSGCTVFASDYEGAYRQAVAAATFDEVDFGPSTFAGMGSGLGVDVQFEC
ncbi:MAG: hypothetical protein WDA27_11445 [Actinomycetota bacterium]